MGVREYLDERENELLAEIESIRLHMAMLQAKIVPLEGELAEVRRAKNAIGGIGATTLAEVLTGSTLPLLPPGNAPPVPFGYAKTLADLALQTLPIGFGQAGPYDRLTMKELVVHALDVQFHNGATTRKLLDFFRDAWGRNIERTNLSPQLSRLYQEGRIGRAAGYKEWHLMHRNGADPKLQMLLQRHNKEVVYVLPSQMRPDEHVPILTTNDPAPDPDDD